MLDLNNVEVDSIQEFDLIPAGTIARVVLSIKRGSDMIAEFSNEPLFKSSMSGTKWLDCEFTIMGGQFDKRKFWQNIMLDGGKVNPETGMPWTKTIGLKTIKLMVDSAYGLEPSDTSPEANTRRKLAGLEVLDGVDFCVKIGIEKGTNGYADKNKMVIPLTISDKGYIGSSSAPIAPTQPVTPPQPQVTQPNAQPQQAQEVSASNTVPQWAKQ